MWTKFKAWILSVSPEILAFLKPIFSFLTRQVVALAEQAVAEGFKTNGSNEEKMSAALSYFKMNIRLQGKAFVESEARTAIELALQRIKRAV